MNNWSRLYLAAHSKRSYLRAGAVPGDEASVRTTKIEGLQLPSESGCFDYTEANRVRGTAGNQVSVSGADAVDVIAGKRRRVVGSNESVAGQSLVIAEGSKADSLTLLADGLSESVTGDNVQTVVTGGQTITVDSGDQSFQTEADTQALTSASDQSFGGSSNQTFHSDSNQVITVSGKHGLRVTEGLSLSSASSMRMMYAHSQHIYSLATQRMVLGTRIRLGTIADIRSGAVYKEASMWLKLFFSAFQLNGFFAEYDIYNVYADKSLLKANTFILKVHSSPIVNFVDASDFGTVSTIEYTTTPVEPTAI